MIFSTSSREPEPSQYGRHSRASRTLREERSAKRWISQHVRMTACALLAVVLPMLAHPLSIDRRERDGEIGCTLEASGPLLSEAKHFVTDGASIEASRDYALQRRFNVIWRRR